MVKGESVARMVLHVTGIALHVANAGTTVSLRVRVAVNAAMTAVHVANVEMTVSLHAKAVVNVARNVVLHARTAKEAGMLQVAASHLNAKVPATASHPTRTVSNHCVAVRAREMISNLKANKFIRYEHITFG
jgi:hypothetical protein